MTDPEPADPNACSCWATSPNGCPVHHYADLTGGDDEDDGSDYFRGLDRLDDRIKIEAESVQP
jgi:hypothetical protein